MKFALYDPTGAVVATGQCPDGMEHLQARPGTQVFLGEANTWDSIDLATGALIPGVKPDPTYRELRLYPSVESQLDQLWHAMDAGEIPKAGNFYESIKAIKDAYPRPEPVFDAYKMPED